MDGGAWWATVQEVPKSWTRLSNFTFTFTTLLMGFPGDTSGKESAHRKYKRCRFNPWVGKIPWKSIWQPTPLFLPGESHVQKSMEGYSPQGRKDSGMTKAN